ncbi:hypothetical protein M758_2G118600 [Ceratodon purpureus]|nr:hypothetical protein M758_2G118600 [Ceratodon purpureus]
MVFIPIVILNLTLLGFFDELTWFPWVADTMLPPSDFGICLVLCRYKATVEAVTPGGYFVVYDEWGNKEEVDVSKVRELNIPDGDAEILDQMLDGADPSSEAIDNAPVDPLLDAEQEANLTRLALKKKIEDAADIDVISRDLPPKLRIKPDDSEDVRAAKKKKIHAFKSKARLEQMELTQNKRQNAWQQFQTTKGKTKKVSAYSFLCNL